MHFVKGKINRSDFQVSVFKWETKVFTIESDKDLWKVETKKRILLSPTPSLPPSPSPHFLSWSLLNENHGHLNNNIIDAVRVTVGEKISSNP